MRWPRMLPNRFRRKPQSKPEPVPKFPEPDKDAATMRAEAMKRHEKQVESGEGDKNRHQDV
jgi:hypothetical protein